MNELIKVEGGVTMTSLELVEFINSQRGPDEAELRHDSFMVKVPKVLGIAAPKFFGTDFYTNGTGAKVERNVYHFPKREACLMAMSYSYDLQAKVFDRMTELEGKKFAIPTTKSEALRLAADLAEKVEQQAALIEQQASKVEFHDAVAESINSQTIYEIAKELNVGSVTMFDFLREQGVLIQKDTMPYQRHIDAGRFRVVMKKRKDKHGEIHTYHQTLVTGKGVVYIQKLVSAHPELKSKRKNKITS